MARRKPHPDPTNINPNTVRAHEIADATRNTQGAYEEIPGTAPRDARIVNPLDGSKLMQENAAYVRFLFPYLNESTFLIANGQVACQPRSFARFPFVGNSFALTFSNTGVMLTTGNLQPAVFRLRRNAIPIMDWDVVLCFTSHVATYGKPTSPFAGPDTFFQTATGFRIPNQLYGHIIKMDFDEVEFFNANTATALSVNAVATSGNAELIPTPNPGA